MTRACACAFPLTLLALLAAPLAAQEPLTAQEPTREPGFLGVSMAPWTIPGSDPAQALVSVTGVVAGSAAERAGLVEGDLIVEVDGVKLAAAPGEVLQRFGALVRERGVGADVRLVVRRRSLSSRTYVDEEPVGPPQDASGARARASLPDLGDLAEANPGRLVSVRVRQDEREREVVATLGARPGQTAEPLPGNASLRPDLEALPLDAGAALAERLLARAAYDVPADAERGLDAQRVTLASRLQDVRERLERDEQVHDAFRLATVRYLKRDPLRLAGATRALASSLAAVHAGARGASPTGAQGLADVARASLDAVGAVDTQVPPARPEPGAVSREGVAGLARHADYLEASLDLAHARVERALAALSPDERALLADALPSLADTFAARLYLHEDEDLERWARHQRAIALLARVDRGALLAALEALLPLSEPAYLGALEEDLLAAEGQGASAPWVDGVQGRTLFHRPSRHGLIIFGGSGPNEYRAAADGTEPAAIVDLGGDDAYHGRAGGAAPGRPVAVAIDLDGDDRYQASVSFAQGAALLGAALLVDQAGDDAYTSSAPFAQGAALCGAALLVDVVGSDVYRAPVYAQGAALCQGVGALLDGGGDDRHTVGLYGQGFAGPGGFGALVARGGDDRYEALGREPSTYGDVGYHAMSQGSSVGFRHLASGGIAALVDDGGRDRYEAGNFSQGGGYYFGWGLLADLGDQADVYEGSRYAAGFAAHSAVGSFLDAGGDDRYRGWVGAQCGAAWDLCVTSFADDGGDDVYETGPGFSVGASAHNGVALFVDRGGRDRYVVAPGRAGPNDYHGGHSVSVFIDAGGGRDEYGGGGLEDGKGTTHADGGVIVDLPGGLEDLPDEALEALLGPR